MNSIPTNALIDAILQKNNARHLLNARNPTNEEMEAILKYKKKLQNHIGFKRVFNVYEKVRDKYFANPARYYEIQGATSNTKNSNFKFGDIVNASVNDDFYPMYIVNTKGVLEIAIEVEWFVVRKHISRYVNDFVTKWRYVLDKDNGIPVNFMYCRNDDKLMNKVFKAPLPVHFSARVVLQNKYEFTDCDAIEIMFSKHNKEHVFCLVPITVTNTTINTKGKWSISRINNIYKRHLSSKNLVWFSGNNIMKTKNAMNNFNKTFPNALYRSDNKQLGFFVGLSQNEAHKAVKKFPTVSSVKVSNQLSPVYNLYERF